MRLHRGPTGDPDPALDLAVAHALLRRASRGEVRQAVRVYHPPSPVAVFSRRDTRLPGFPVAAEAARRAGFAPLVRNTGGRAVAYTPAALVVDVVHHERNAAAGLERRFADYSLRFAEVLGSLGVDARVGPVPGEYCPGAHSVSARGEVKLVGTSQRVVRDAWHFSALLVLDEHEALRAVLQQVYAGLDQPLEASSVGSFASEHPHLDVEELTARVVRAFAGDVEASPIDPDTVELARTLVLQHTHPGS